MQLGKLRCELDVLIGRDGANDITVLDSGIKSQPDDEAMP